jgi:hypothetical protein
VPTSRRGNAEKLPVFVACAYMENEVSYCFTWNDGQTLNLLVLGSSPRRPTIFFNEISNFQKAPTCGMWVIAYLFVGTAYLS